MPFAMGVCASLASVLFTQIACAYLATRSSKKDSMEGSVACRIMCNDMRAAVSCDISPINNHRGRDR